MAERLRQLKVLGHPSHVALTHFPLALWTAGFIGDLFHFWRGDLFWWDFARWNIALGLGIGCLTLLTGFYDFFFIPSNKPLAAEAAVRHMMVMLVAACFFATSLYFHWVGAPPARSQEILGLVLSTLGALFLHLGGWLGGQLVYHYGIGYDD